MDRNNSERSHHETESMTGYAIKSVNSEVIDNFVYSHAGENNSRHWVGMGMKVDANGFPLFTFGSGPCTDFLFVSPSQEIQLAHLPYVFIPNPDESYLTREELKVRELESEYSNKPEFSLILFSMAPYDNSPQAINNKNKTLDSLMERFRRIGLNCFDMTTNDANLSVYGLIADPKSRLIQVCYEQKTN